MEAFGAAAERYFGELARSCNATLQRVTPSIFGFETGAATVTIAVYPGHVPTIMAKTRNRAADDRLSVDDVRDIGASWFLLRETGRASKPMPSDTPWTPEIIGEAVEQEASILRQYAWSYLTDPTADWDEMRVWRDKQVFPPEVL